MNKELSGAATDVLRALFIRGATLDGDLPSKSGVSELRELGYVKTRNAAVAFGGENYYSFLTPSGQEFAISYLVDGHSCSIQSQNARDAVQAVVGRYLTGAATEYADDMVDELMALHTVSTISDQVDSSFARRPPRSVRELVIKASVDTSELQLAIDEVLNSIRKSDVFKILSAQTFINHPMIKGADVDNASINGVSLKGAGHFTTCSDKRLMEPLTGPGWRITNVSPKVSLSDDMRDAVIAAVRDSGQFVEKPTDDVQQSVVFLADRFKVTDGASASGEPTTQEKIQQGLAYEIEAVKASLARHEAMMADLAVTQAALKESIKQAVNDAIANALKPGGLLYGMSRCQR